LTSLPGTTTTRFGVAPFACRCTSGLATAARFSWRNTALGTVESYVRSLA